ncbi:hypothetical protein FRC17_002904 [Serendipita sp. 399]|nr:hypothetical protein FRC17_002904 [Serendipita sp. 399]
MSSTTTSPEFPQGYGDFKLISSDNVTFHFSKFLLSYQSSVFEGMFSAGASSAHQSDELQLTEDSATLECLLRYLDPKKTPIPPTIDNAEPLLEACRKYDLPTVAQRWEEHLMTKWKGIPASDEAVSRPMECLAIASRSNLDQLARFCLREVIKAPMALLTTSNIVLESRLLVHLLKLKVDRMDWFENKFAAFFASNVGESCNSIYSHNAMERAAFEVIRALHQEPSLRALSRYTNAWDSPCGHFQGSATLFNSWRGEIEALEAALPELPSRQ